MKTNQIRRFLLTLSLAGAVALPATAHAQGARRRPSSDAKQGETRSAPRQAPSADERKGDERQSQARQSDERRSAPPQNDQRQSNQRQVEPQRRDAQTTRPSVGSDQRRPAVEPERRSDIGRYAVPRREVAPPQYNRPYDNRGPVRFDGPRYAPRVSTRGIIRPWNAVRFYQPYYSFRPRLSLGFGISIGYAVAYPYDWYDPFAYSGAYGTSIYRSSYGGVSFDLDPQDAALYVDGDYVGEIGEFSPYDAPLTLPTGVHRIDIRANGYRTLSFDIRVISGQVIPYEGRLAWVR